jgi:hypothetical protein
MNVITDSDLRWITSSVVVICACVCVCNFIVQAFRFARWLVAKLKPEPQAPPSPPLKLGYCQCGHARCHHEAGVGECHVWMGPVKDDPEPGGCACQVYIYDPDEDGDDDDDTPEPEPDLSVKELERIRNL